MTPLEAQVRTACIELLAAGVRPTGPELAARIPWRTKEDLIRVRTRLVARGDLPAAAGRRSTPADPRPDPGPIPDDERRAVIAACRAFLADGLYPSVDRLVARFRDVDRRRLARIRDEAAAAGLIVLGSAGGGGLHGRTEKERTEVEERTDAIRAKKVARGEVAMPVVMRVARDRHLDRWFIGRRT